MARRLVAGIETGGTHILAQIGELANGKIVDQGQWATGTAEQAAETLLGFLDPRRAEIAAVGIAAFGPLVIDPSSPDYGKMLATPKPGWAGSNLRAALEERLGVPVAVDTDVNAAAIAEQTVGAGQGVASVAYVTVGTGIGAGLAIEGRGLRGALHPEGGHLRLRRRAGDDLPSGCRFHQDCAEGLIAGPAVRRRLGGGDLRDDPATIDLAADYLGQLAASLVLAWSPGRILWGGGVIRAAPIAEAIQERMLAELNGYGVGPAVGQPGFCALAALEHSGLEGAVVMARGLAELD
ncbi:MAG: ROK family protein [Sphingomicrobium sp.]